MEFLYYTKDNIGAEEMGRRKDKREESHNPETNKQSGIMEILNMPIASAIIGGIIVAIFTVCMTDYRDNTTAIIEMRKDVEGISADIKEIKDNFSSDMNSMESRLKEDIRGIEEDIAKLEERVFGYHNLVAEVSDFSFPSISKRDINILSAPEWSSADIIAYDVESGKQYMAKELSNEKLLLSTIGANGQETYFYGQFNEKNQWDGNCIINVYQNESLILITDAQYQNGKLLEYKQIIQDDKVWIVSERKREENFNSGDTWTYVRDKNYLKTFDSDIVTISDIHNVDMFSKNVIADAKLEGYYKGNTSDGFYNDDTGEAYLVKYATDGTIRYFYHGKIRNGYPNDNTGNAWDIAKGVDTEYMYYKGVFENGTARKDRDPKHIFINPITVEEIEKLIAYENIEEILKCDLQWYE